MTKDKTEIAPAEIIADADLDQAQGGVLIGLLLPAVQKVREAASRTSISDGTSNTIANVGATKAGDGSV